MRVVITGATGNVGTSVIDALYRASRAGEGRAVRELVAAQVDRVRPDGDLREVQQVGIRGYPKRVNIPRPGWVRGLRGGQADR